MSREGEPAKYVEKLVVLFDIRSSTPILEHLSKDNRIDAWKDFHIRLKDWLRDESASRDFILYKFIGDGWILLFEPTIDPTRFIDTLNALCAKFRISFDELVRPRLEYEPKMFGLTIGIAEGNLLTFVMNEKDEYIGRTINIAARLQSKAKKHIKETGYRALMSSGLFNKRFSHASKLIVARDSETLAGINENKQFPFVVLELSDKASVTKAETAYFYAGSPCEMSGQKCPACDIGTLDIDPSQTGVECQKCGAFFPAVEKKRGN
jgi:class 3 adenylate cyclase